MKFNSILKFIIHLSTIYVNPIFTVYLIKVVWGGDARVCTRVNWMLLGCQKLEKLFYENVTLCLSGGSTVSIGKAWEIEVFILRSRQKSRTSSTPPTSTSTPRTLMDHHQVLFANFRITNRASLSETDTKILRYSYTYSQNNHAR